MLCVLFCVRSPSSCVPCEYPCVLGRFVPSAHLRLRSLPHLSCVFVLFPFPSARAHVAFPCAFLPIEPARSEFLCLRSHALRQRREPARTRTVFPIPSPLPLSRDAGQLVTSSCRVQVGCSGHHSPPQYTYFSTRSRTISRSDPLAHYLASLLTVCSFIPQQDTSTS